MSMASDLWQEHFYSIIVWKTKYTSWGPEFSHISVWLTLPELTIKYEDHRWQSM